MIPSLPAPGLTPEQVAFLHYMWRRTGSVDDMIDEYHEASGTRPSHNTMSYWLYELGLITQPTRPPTEKVVVIDEPRPIDDEAILRQLYIEQRLSAQEIAKVLGVGTMTVWRRLREFGIETRKVGPRRRGQRTKARSYVREQLDDRG